MSIPNWISLDLTHVEKMFDEMSRSQMREGPGLNYLIQSLTARWSAPPSWIGPALSFRILDLYLRTREVTVDTEVRIANVCTEYSKGWMKRYGNCLS